MAKKSRVLLPQHPSAWGLDERAFRLINPGFVLLPREVAAMIESTDDRIRIIVRRNGILEVMLDDTSGLGELKPGDETPAGVLRTVVEVVDRQIEALRADIEYLEALGGTLTDAANKLEDA